jgi:hypothetical protein
MRNWLAYFLIDAGALGERRKSKGKGNDKKQRNFETCVGDEVGNGHVTQAMKEGEILSGFCPIAAH